MAGAGPRLVKGYFSRRKFPSLRLSKNRRAGLLLARIVTVTGGGAIELYLYKGDA